MDNCCSGTPVARDLLVDTEGCGGALNGIYAYQGDTADGRSRFAGPCKNPPSNHPLATKNLLEDTDGLRRPPYRRGATQSISALSMR